MKKNTIRAAALALLTLAIAAPSAQAKVLQMPQAVCDGGDTLIAVLTWGGGIVAVAGLMLIGYNLVVSHRREDGSFTLMTLGKWGIGAILIGSPSLIAGLFINAALTCGG